MADNKKKGILEKFPLPLIVIITYIAIGVLSGIWHPTWLLFLLIPLWESMLSARKHRHLSYFCFPVLVIAAYLVLGFVWGLWHPGWLLFLSIPLFYALADCFSRDDKDKE